MIFSRIFAASHTSQKPEKRLEAIKKLSPEKPQDKTTLHELAFNDDNADVSLAALEKLNSFVLWQKMAQIAKSPKVKKAAQHCVNEAISGKGNVALSDEEKSMFLQETANVDVIIDVVQREPALLDNTDLALSLLSKVDKPSFTQFVFLNVNNSQLQHQLISSQSQTNTLQKWAKKRSEPDILDAINIRIDEIRAAEQKPVELKKQLTLCLSKYRALLDKIDVEQVVELQASYQSELEGLFAQAGILSSEDKQEFDEKRSKIAEQVTRYIDRIRPAWEEKQKSAVLANTQALCEQQLTHAKEQVGWLYNTRLCEATLADVATVNESVRGLEATLEQLGKLGSNDKRVNEIQVAVDGLNGKLEAFSMQQQYGQKLLSRLTVVEDVAQKLISDDLDDAEKRDVRNAFDVAVDEYSAISRELIAQPKALLQRFKAATQQVRAGEKADKSKHLDELRQVRKQISIVDNLVSQGKFRAAMAKFRKLSENITSLPEITKKDIDKRFQKTANDIARLEGWQSYIAAPRKPALVEEAKELAATPVENIKKRSESIKYLRSQWLSLNTPSASGSEQEDAALQQDFDNALEKAFEPCREHYAKLDAERTAALELRRSIIDKVASVPQDTDPSDLSKILDRLAKQWRACGQVEKQTYEQLKIEWKAVFSPLQKRVYAWQSDNQVLKQGLVDKVNALRDADDISDAAELAQQLQHEWKRIGHAGKREESRLWAEFKASNDAIFERLKNQRKDQANEYIEQAEQLMTSIASISLEGDDNTFQGAIQPLQEAALVLPKPQRVKVERKLEALAKNRESAQRDNDAKVLEARAHAITRLLHNEEPEARDELLETLGKRWSNLLINAHTADTPRHDRTWLTVALEVASGMPSPQSDASVRSSVQLQMMTAKLELGEAPEAEEILHDWLLHGEVKKSESGLLQRVVTIINNNPSVLA
jgi:exonuclease SbcC